MRAENVYEGRDASNTATPVFTTHEKPSRIEPFFPRQSAHERANPNQPFYRGIHGKRRQMR